MVGTPEYQVTWFSRTVLQKDKALNFVGTTTVPPEIKLAMVEPINPWTWNSGIMQSETSAGVSAYVFAIFAEETARLKCRRGTRFGRPVLPLVWRTRAISSAVGSVAFAPEGAFTMRTIPCSVISTEKIG